MKRREQFKRDVTHDSTINLNSSRCFNESVEPHVDTNTQEALQTNDTFKGRRIIFVI